MNHAVFLLRSIVGAAIAAVLATLVATAAMAAEPAYPTGSRVGLVPPGKMQTSGTMRGFEDKDAQAMMLVLEMPAAAYAEVEKGLDAEALKKQGMTEEKREPLTIAAGKGVLITGRQEADGKTGRKWVFIAALDDLTALIAVQAPDAAAKDYPDAAIRTALNSIALRASVPIDELLQLVPIVFDELAGLRPIRVAPNAVLLTDGPKDTVEAAEQPVLAVSLGMGGPEGDAARDTFARNLLGGMPELKGARIVSRDMIKRGTQHTHEIQAEGADAKTGAPMKLVQWVRFGSGAYLRLVGMSRADDWRDVFPRLRAVREGIKPRG